MADLEDKLLPKGRKQTQKMAQRFEECEKKIKTVRTKNNQLQKEVDNELQGDIRNTIKSQTYFLDHQIKDMKKCLEQLAKDFTDPSSKNRIRTLCSMASKQMERNKRIMAEFVNRASSSSEYKRQSTANAYRRSRTQFDKDVISQSRETKLHPVYEKQDSSYMESNEQLSDIKIEQKMMAERNVLIRELQEKNNKINEIINEMGGLVCEQRDMVDQIGDNLEDVKENMEDVNENMKEARRQQRKSKRKYIMLVTTIIIILLIVGGIIYFLGFS